MRKKTVVLSMLGPSLDAGKGMQRWERWRPTVALCQHESLLVDRLELVYQRAFADLARVVTEDIAHVSPETRVELHPVDLPDPWDFEQVYGTLHDFARSYTWDTAHDDYLVHITTGTHVAQICLFLLTESRHMPGRLLQTSPPRRDHLSPHGTYAVIDLDLSRYDRLASRFATEQREALSSLKAGIDTQSARYNLLIERVEQVAVASRAPILLTGPTGAGKTQLARRIFELKKARMKLEGDLVDVNCATLRGDQAMSTLFGHVKGAFTGALTDRAGLLKKADRGLLFLDEIGELGLDEQAMLLRAIEEKVFYPVGADREARSDFQLIAGTNRDLRTRVADGKFRDDLLARLDLWTFTLPGLADRREDIEPNLRFELDAASRTLGRHVTISKEARERYLRFATAASSPWKGNFRDLSASVLRMATLANGGRIALPQVDEEIDRLRASWRTGVEPTLQGDLCARVLGEDAASSLDRFDRVQLEDVLRVCAQSDSLSAAGRVLFACSREKKTSSNDADRLRKYLARFELSWSDIASLRGS